MNPLQWLTLVMVMISAPAVVLSREPVSQAVSLSFYGILFSLLFLVFQAPDVSLSQIVIGSVALPLMVLLALGKIRRDREGQKK